MDKATYAYYEHEGWWIGWLSDYPDYQTQGETMEELEENLKDMFVDLTSGAIPCVRRLGELVIN